VPEKSHGREEEASREGIPFEEVGGERWGSQEGGWGASSWLLDRFRRKKTQKKNFNS